MLPDQRLAYALRTSSASPAVGYHGIAPGTTQSSHRRSADHRRLMRLPHLAQAAFGAQPWRTMLVEVSVPQLSESVSEATLLAWHKKPGEFVQRDENLIDIETDKVVLELPAPEAGRADRDRQGRRRHGRQQRSDRHHRHRRKGACRQRRRSAARRPRHRQHPLRSQRRWRRQNRCSPAVSKAARRWRCQRRASWRRKQGVDLTQIEGTGRGGRVTKEDVVTQLAEPAAKPAPAPMPVDIAAGARGPSRAARADVTAAAARARSASSSRSPRQRS